MRPLRMAPMGRAGLRTGQLLRNLEDGPARALSALEVKLRS